MHPPRKKVHSQIFNFPLCLFSDVKANCQVDDLDWIWEPVEPATRKPAPKIIYFHSAAAARQPCCSIVQPPRRLPSKWQILSFSMKSTSFGKLLRLLAKFDDNGIAYFPEELCAKATRMREEDRIWNFLNRQCHSQFNAPHFLCLIIGLVYFGDICMFFLLNTKYQNIR